MTLSTSETASEPFFHAETHPGTAESHKIPYVCKAEGVACIAFQEMMHAEGWQFR